MHEILRDLATMFDGYHQLRKFADANHCKIINKTKENIQVPNMKKVKITQNFFPKKWKKKLILLQMNVYLS